MNEDFQVSVFDAIGREVYSASHNAAKEGIIEIDMSAFNSGIYMVSLLSDKVQKSERLIIQ